MSGNKTGMSFGRPVRELWHALLLIVPITFSWLWFVIRNANLPPEKRSELFWDMSAKNMDKFAKNEGIKKFESVRNEKLERYLPGRDRVLDYGCGTGTLSLMVAGRVREILGIDYAAGMIGVAERKAAESGAGNLRFMRATIFNPQLEKGSYDAVLAWGILHLVDDRKSVVKRIHELLGPGGIIVSATECMAEKTTPITSLLSFLMKIGIFPLSLHYFTVSELEESFTGAGFQIVEKEILGDNPVSCFIAAIKTKEQDISFTKYH